MSDMSRLQFLLRQPAARRIAWFILLWLVGFVGTALLALPLHLLVVAAKT